MQTSDMTRLRALEQKKPGTTEIVLQDGSTRYYTLADLSPVLFDAMIGHKTPVVIDLGNVAYVRGRMTPFLDNILKACAHFRNTGASVYPHMYWDEQQQKVIGYDDSNATSNEIEEDKDSES